MSLCALSASVKPSGRTVVLPSAVSHRSSSKDLAGVLRDRILRLSTRFNRYVVHFEMAFSKTPNFS